MAKCADCQKFIKDGEYQDFSGACKVCHKEFQKMDIEYYKILKEQAKNNPFLKLLKKDKK